MPENPILDRIDALVDEEHRLWAESEQGRLDEEGPDAPDTPPDVPDPPNDLDGPDPEPRHLDHGVHANEPAPEPDVPRDIP